MLSCLINLSCTGGMCRELSIHLQYASCPCNGLLFCNSAVFSPSKTCMAIMSAVIVVFLFSSLSTGGKSLNNVQPNSCPVGSQSWSINFTSLILANQSASTVLWFLCTQCSTYMRKPLQTSCLPYCSKFFLLGIFLGVYGCKAKCIQHPMRKSILWQTCRWQRLLWHVLYCYTASLRIFPKWRLLA